MKKLKVIFIALFLFNLQYTFAQNQHVIDSLKNELQKPQADTTKLDELGYLISRDTVTDSLGQLNYIHQYKALAKKINDPERTASLDFWIAEYWKHKGQPGKRKAWLLSFLEKCLAIKGNDGWDGYNKLFYAAMDVADFNEAMNYSLKLLNLAEHSSNKLFLEEAYANLGWLFQVKQDAATALKYYKKSLEMAEAINDSFGMAAQNCNVGNMHTDLNNLDSAKIYLYRSIQLKEELKDRNGLVWPFYMISQTYLQEHKIDSALLYGRKSIAVQVSEGKPAFNSEAYVGMGRIFLELNKTDSALFYLNQAREMIEPTTSREGLRWIYKELANGYEKSGNYTLAYKYLLKSTTLGDSIFNAQNSKIQSEMDVKYQSSEKEKEIAVQNEQIRKQRLTNYFIAGIAAILVLFVGFVYRNYRQKKKANIALQLAKEKAEDLKERAEKSERFKQQFLTNMSHEIRTPMNAVMGMTELLMDKNPRADQFSYLDGIRRSSDTLLHIINDILDSSKIEAGKVELEQIDFSLRETLDQVKQTLSFRAEEKGLQLIAQVDGNVPDVLIGDPVRLNQILINLAGNAIKFTEKGSVSLEVKSERSKVNDEEIKPHVSLLTFHVTDTGIGIPKEKMQIVFESFSQVYSSDSRKFGGTGLGLSISKQLVELQGGEISIESEEGKGTTFSFSINYHLGSKEKLQQRIQQEEKIDGSILNGLKILLADDNEYNRVVASDTLKSKASVEIDVAANGEEAIQHLEKNNYDVILMDVQMPVMDGFEATKYIREKFAAPKNGIPIIALTASVLRTDLDRCTQAGMNAYVSKPFKAWQLIASIAEVTGRKKNAARIISIGEKQIKAGEEINIPVTDLTYLEKFCEADKMKMEKYVSMFLGSAPLFIEKINQAVAKNDTKEIAKQVHGYKTKWIMMGMKRTGDLAMSIEQQCHGEVNVDLVNEKISLLLKQINTAINELRQA